MLLAAKVPVPAVRTSLDQQGEQCSLPRGPTTVPPANGGDRHRRTAWRSQSPAPPTAGTGTAEQHGGASPLRPTAGTGTSEQHGGASPLRRGRHKARERIGMRLTPPDPCPARGDSIQGCRDSYLPSNRLSCSANCLAAWPRWLREFFRSAGISAMVWPKRGTRKMGS